MEHVEIEFTHLQQMVMDQIRVSDPDDLAHLVERIWGVEAQYDGELDEYTVMPSKTLAEESWGHTLAADCFDDFVDTSGLPIQGGDTNG